MSRDSDINAVLSKMIGTVTVALVLGGLLAIADHYSVLPWAIGLMLACLSVNIQTLTADK